CRDQVINAWLNGGYRLEHVQLCKRTHTTLVVPVLLQQPGAFTVIGMLVPILLPVMGMLVLPVSLAIALVGSVIRISGQFGVLPAGFSVPLAGLVGTEPLTFDAGIRQKMTATMGTADGAVHGFLLREAGHLKNRLLQEE